MGYRAFLQVYLHEDRVHEDEKKYYDAYLKCNWDSIEEQKKLVDFAKKVKYIWNDNFDNLSNQIPSCQYVTLNGKSYYAPDNFLSQEEDLRYERKNTVPDTFLVLFTKEEYKDTCRNNTFNKEVSCNKFYTTIDKALDRLSKQNLLNSEYTFMKEFLSFVPSDSLLELDISEIIDNPEMYETTSIEDVFTRMESLRRA